MKSLWPAVALLAACEGSIALPGLQPIDPFDPDPTNPPPEEICTHAGRSVIRRLTRTEYSNTVRDLFGTSAGATAMLPFDSAGASGFDTDAQSLSMSPQMFEPYLAAAEAVANETFAGPAKQKFLAACTAGVACAEQSLRASLPRLYRRPVTDDDVADLMSVYQANAVDGFEPAMAVVLQAALVSPRFLYLTYGEPDPQSLATLDDWTLAAQLSYFLWSSTPDDVLLAAAGQGTLHEPATFAAQVRRMLMDGKALALTDALTEQWLGTGELLNATRNPTLYPSWSPALRDAMLAETRAFVRALLTDDRPVRELLSADYSFVDPTLAQHYGLPAVSGLTRVTLPPESHRRGLLTQGAFLAMTSTSERTNPVRRGRWVLLQALCGELPPRPAGVPALPNDGAQEGGVKEQLAQHRTNPNCSGCHTMMDPIGLGLEHFDAVGLWRETYRDGSVIDATGKLPSGATFTSVPELAESLMLKGDFDRCISRRLLAYAVSRNLTRDDRCVADKLGGPTTTFSSLLLSIAQSAPFQQREGAAP